MQLCVGFQPLPESVHFGLEFFIVGFSRGEETVSEVVIEGGSGEVDTGEGEVSRHAFDGVGDQLEGFEVAGLEALIKADPVQFVNLFEIVEQFQEQFFIAYSFHGFRFVEDGIWHNNTPVISAVRTEPDNSDFRSNPPVWSIPKPDVSVKQKGVS